MFVLAAQSYDVQNLATLPAPRRSYRAAAAVTALLCAFAVAAIVARNVQGPAFAAVVPLQEALVFAAYVFTSYLMFSQFRSTGLLVLATTGSGYLLLSLLQIPYVLSFPDVWVKGQLAGNPWTPAWVGLAWHAAFPVLVGIHVTYDRTFNAAIEEKYRASITRVAVALTAVVAGLLALAMLGDQLPVLYENGRFAHAFVVLGWTVTGINVATCAALLARTRCRTILQLWLAVGLLGMGLDELIYAVSPTRYVASWYLAKVAALVTAATILVVLLRQVTALYRRVAELATIDPLTTLPNRRTLEGQLDWIVRYGERHGIALAVVMVDVDHFKDYNDAFGHAAGDAVLRAVAETLRANVLRASDLVARYGGEEFVALLPDATREGTLLAVERMRLAVERLAIRHEARAGGRLTISIGAAVGVIGETGPRELLRAADEALYAAKDAGRNRSVVVACGDGKRAATPGAPLRL
jgi:diguanylate cyclase (GGDEF)-like protein